MNIVEGTKAHCELPVRVCSIDGGGIRGIIPGMLLDHFEKLTGERASNLFDVFAGCSTGAFFALSLNVPHTYTIGGTKKEGPPTAARIVEVYVEHGKEIFPDYHCKKIFGAVEPLYKAEPFEKLAKKLLGDTKLHELINEVVIPTFDINNIKALCLTRKMHEREKHGVKRYSHFVNFTVGEALRATTAAPTYFMPYHFKAPAVKDVEVPKGKSPFKDHFFIDGGTFANNPASKAVTFVGNHYGQGRDMIVCSLGTGKKSAKIGQDCFWNFGYTGWATKILPVEFEADNASTHQDMKCRFKTKGPDKQYYRFQVGLEPAHTDMDDAGKENIEYLKAISKKLIEENDETIREMCKKLEPREKK